MPDEEGEMREGNITDGLNLDALALRYGLVRKVETDADLRERVQREIEKLIFPPKVCAHNQAYTCWRCWDE